MIVGQHLLLRRRVHLNIIESGQQIVRSLISNGSRVARHGLYRAGRRNFVGRDFPIFIQNNHPRLPAVGVLLSIVNGIDRQFQLPPGKAVLVEHIGADEFITERALVS